MSKALLVLIGFLIAMEICSEIYPEQNSEQRFNEAISEFTDILFYGKKVEKDEILGLPISNEPYSKTKLTFQIESLESFDKNIEIRGVVTNSGQYQWDESWGILSIELVDNENGVIAECSELMGKLEPGESESLITDCRVIKEPNNDLANLSVKVH